MTIDQNEKSRMKDNYTEPEVEIVVLDSKDVITTSSCTGSDYLEELPLHSS